MAIETAQAVKAYAEAARMQGVVGAGADAAPMGAPDFGRLVEDAVGGAIETTRHAEAMSLAGIDNEAPLVDVVTALSAAEVTVKSVVAVRDKVITAYQEIMRMPI